jgi:hypothetical protein
LAWSALRIALRMSSIDGSGGDRRIPSVTSVSAVSDAMRSVPSAWRKSHSVSAQSSPSAWTSGPAKKMLPKSPSVYPPVPAVAVPGQSAAEAPTGQSAACERRAWSSSSV